MENHKQKEKKVQKIYRIGATCPHCGEEHQCWNLTISDEEQSVVDAYYEENKDRSHIESLLSDPPLYVERELKCGCCGESFKGLFAIRKEFELGYRNPGCVSVCSVPL